MSDLPAGYLVRVTSWENDADNYKTVERAGLSESDARFFIRAAQLFRSVNRHEFGDAPRFGNADIRGDRPGRANDAGLPDALEALVREHKAVFGSVPQYWDTDTWKNEAQHAEYRVDYTHEVFYDLIGTWAEGEYWRVYESHVVLFVPEVIRDVTASFATG
jgi:hypothetical protein